MKEELIKEILPYLKDMNNILINRSYNNKIVIQRLGNHEFILLETNKEKVLFCLIGNYYSIELWKRMKGGLKE